MTERNSAGSPANATPPDGDVSQRSRADDPSMGESMTSMDCWSQELLETVEPLVDAVKAMIAANTSEKSITAILDRIADATFETMNRINAEAEKHGAHYRGETRYG